MGQQELAARQAHHARALHLFSGPADRVDGIAAYLGAVGVKMECVDLVNVGTADMDISDDSVWNRLRAKLIGGIFSFLFAGPPCRTFSSARHVRPGPPTLRDRSHPYGFPKSQARERGLRPGDYDKIRMDNLMAVRTAEACTILHDLGSGYAVEQPWPRSHAVVSMFDLEPFTELQKRGAKVVVFDQCMYDAHTTKPTQVLYHQARFDLLGARCDHPSTSHTESDGSTTWAPHPPCVGLTAKSGDYVTKGLAAYPGTLNKRIAAIINASLAPAL